MALTVALIAHDRKKPELRDCVARHHRLLIGCMIGQHLVLQ